MLSARLRRLREADDGVKCLNLASYKFTTEDCRQLAAYMEETTSLEELNLSRCSITASGFCELANSAVRLTSLNVSENFIDETGKERLAKVLVASMSSSKLRYFRCDEYFLGPDTRVLTLGGAGLSPSDGIILAGLLRASTGFLTSLDLSDNALGAEFGFALADALATNVAGGLTELDVRGNELGKAAAKEVAHAVAANSRGSSRSNSSSRCALRHLGLARNGVDADGILSVAFSLQQCDQLRSMDLSDMAMGPIFYRSASAHEARDPAGGTEEAEAEAETAAGLVGEGYASLADLVAPPGSRLVELRLAGNVLYWRGCCAIADALGRGSSIAALDLSDCGLVEVYDSSGHACGRARRVNMRGVCALVRGILKGAAAAAGKGVAWMEAGGGGSDGRREAVGRGSNSGGFGFGLADSSNREEEEDEEDEDQAAAAAASAPIVSVYSIANATSTSRQAQTAGVMKGPGNSSRSISSSRRDVSATTAEAENSSGTANGITNSGSGDTTTSSSSSSSSSNGGSSAPSSSRGRRSRNTLTSLSLAGNDLRGQGAACLAPLVAAAQRRDQFWVGVGVEQGGSSSSSRGLGLLHLDVSRNRLCDSHPQGSVQQQRKKNTKDKSGGRSGRSDGHGDSNGRVDDGGGDGCTSYMVSGGGQHEHGLVAFLDALVVDGSVHPPDEYAYAAGTRREWPGGLKSLNLAGNDIGRSGSGYIGDGGGGATGSDDDGRGRDRPQAAAVRALCAVLSMSFEAHGHRGCTLNAVDLRGNGFDDGFLEGGEGDGHKEEEEEEDEEEKEGGGKGAGSGRGGRGGRRRKLLRCAEVSTLLTRALAANTSLVKLNGLQVGGGGAGMADVSGCEGGIRTYELAFVGRRLRSLACAADDDDSDDGDGGSSIGSITAKGRCLRRGVDMVLHNHWDWRQWGLLQKEAQQQQQWRRRRRRRSFGRDADGGFGAPPPRSSGSPPGSRLVSADPDPPLFASRAPLTALDLSHCALCQVPHASFSASSAFSSSSSSLLALAPSSTSDGAGAGAGVGVLTVADEAVRLLANGIGAHPSLRHLDLSANALTPTAARLLVRGVRANAGLQSVRLGGITHGAGICLARIAARGGHEPSSAATATATASSLSRSPSPSPCACLLPVQCLREGTLRHLDLRGCGLGVGGAVFVAQLVAGTATPGTGRSGSGTGAAGTPYLETLTLRAHPLPVRMLAGTDDDNDVVTITLSECDLGILDAVVIGELLQWNSTATALDLSQNCLGPVGARFVCEALLAKARRNGSGGSGTGAGTGKSARITRLRLATNAIGQEGAGRVRTMVEQLQQLQLQQLQLQQHGQRQRGQWVEMELVDLRDNMIPTGLASELSEFFGKKRTLLEL